MTAYDTPRAPRLDAVAKQVMRLTAQLRSFFRRTRELIVLAGVLVSSHQVVQVSISGI